MGSPGHAVLWQKGDQLWFGRDSEGLCKAERVFISAPTARELKTTPVCRRVSGGGRPTALRPSPLKSPPCAQRGEILKPRLDPLDLNK